MATRLRPSRPTRSSRKPENAGTGDARLPACKATTFSRSVRSLSSLQSASVLALLVHLTPWPETFDPSQGIWGKVAITLGDDRLADWLAAAGHQG